MHSQTPSEIETRSPDAMGHIARLRYIFSRIFRRGPRFHLDDVQATKREKIVLEHLAKGTLAWAAALVVLGGVGCFRLLLDGDTIATQLSPMKNLLFQSPTTSLIAWWAGLAAFSLAPWLYFGRTVVFLTLSKKPKAAQSTNAGACHIDNYVVRNIDVFIKFYIRSTYGRLHLFCAFWFTVVTMWWLQAYSLLPPSDSDASIFLTRSRFFWMTVILHFLSVICLNRSVVVTLSVLLIGICLPYAFFIRSDIGSEYPDAWLFIFLSIYIIAALYLNNAGRKSIAKEIILEAAKNKANEERSRSMQLLRDTSHDVIQPIVTVGHFVELALQSKDNEKRIAYMRNALDSIKVVDKIARGVLDLAKMQAGVWSISSGELHIKAILDSIKREFYQAAEEKGIELIVVPDYSIVRGDLVALERILRNLVSNAIKYTPALCQRPESPGRVVVKCIQEGEWLQVVVEDNGVGIPDDKTDTIFEVYQQLGNPERDSRKGQGLGLSIVRELAKLLGTSVRVESSLGKGSRFMFDVPFISRMPYEARVPLCYEEERALDFDGMVVLIVEDNAAFREALLLRLESWNCLVIAEETAEDLVATLEHIRVPGRPSLLLTDYRLPNNKSGIEAVESIRISIGWNLPAAILSSEIDLLALHTITETRNIKTLSKALDLGPLIEFLISCSSPESAKC